MVDDDSLYKRVGDKDWRDAVNARLVNLTAAQSETNGRLDEIDEAIAQQDALLEGKPDDKSDGGLKGDIVDISRGLNSLRGIMAPDALGRGGIENRIRALEGAVKDLKESEDSRWKFWTAIAVAFLLIVREVVRDLPEIREMFTPKAVEVTKTKRAKHVKQRHIRQEDDDEDPAPISE